MNTGTKVVSIAIFIFLNLLTHRILAQINGPTSVCGGEVVTYSTTTSANTYNWSAAGAVSVTPNGSAALIEWGYGTTGTVDLAAYNASNNQILNTSLPVVINGVPNPLIQTNFLSSCSESYETVDSCLKACVNTPVVYSSPLIAGATFNWEVIGSDDYTVLSANEIEVIWPTVGVHSIELNISNGNGCFNSSSRCIEVLEKPQAVIGSMPVSSSGTITVCRNSEIFFQDNSSGAISGQWSFGDGNFSSVSDPTYSYDQPGNYFVTLKAINSCNCWDMDTLTVIVEDFTGPEIVCPSVVCEGDTFTYFSPSSCESFSWSATNGQIIGSSSSNSVEVV